MIALDEERPKVMAARAAVSNAATEKAGRGREKAAADGTAAEVQMAYELEGGTFCTHCNHCGVADWLWEMQVLGPDISLTLRVGIPTSSLIGSVDGRAVYELHDERPAACSAAAASLRVRT